MTKKDLKVAGIVKTLQILTANLHCRIDPFTFVTDLHRTDVDFRRSED